MSRFLPPRVRETPATPFAAVLWDFDGTLVDTEPTWQRVEQQTVTALGGEIPDGLAETLVGHSLLHSAEALIALGTNTDASPAQVADHMVDEMTAQLAGAPIPWRPGAQDLLAELSRAGVPQALVSASYRRMLDAVVHRLPGRFDVVVAGDDVTHGKPDPEPYLAAAAALAVDPADCLVLEDSASGAHAGNAAGCFVVAVPAVVTPPAAPRRVLVESLAGLDLAGLSRLWREHA